VTAGAIGMPPVEGTVDFRYAVKINGRLNEARDLENMIDKVGATQGAAGTARAAAGRAAPP
jgi:hypothetical protein